ncbi:MAG: hypothetical protein RXR31_07855 [Thermoproteota archaeon]|jgi:hypothetical protein
MKDQDSFIEELLGAKWKIRILRTIINEKQINISALAKISSTFFTPASNYIGFLKKYGIVKEKRFGKIRIVVANEYSDVLNLLEKLMDKASEVEKLKVESTMQND